LKRFCVAAGVLAAVLSAPAFPATKNAEAYPSRAVRMIVPYPPGGAGDIVGRLLAVKLTEAFGQQVVVDNRGGGGQVIATQLAATAPPDGHTLFLASATHAVNPALRKNLPYDTLKDFAPITLVAQSPLVFLAHPSLGVTSVKELVAAARAKPGRINYASLMCTSPLPSMPHVKAGRLRALAMTSLKRASFAPDIPAVAETVPGFQTALWYALLAPAGTPQTIVRRIQADTVSILRAKDFVQQLESQGAEPVGGSPEALQAHIKAEIGQWMKLVKQAKITAD
jgi:tripartite-type tricarboxylate transporter receptor subunit TctC